MELASTHMTKRAFLAAVLASGVHAAWAAAGNLPVTAAQRAMADRAAAEGVPVESLAPGAPASYTVKRGDTLWNISKLYLRSPWKWPALWGMNRDEVRNPHLIYPGEVLYLHIEGGRARLGRRPGAGGEVHLSPRIRDEDGVGRPISTIPYAAIKPFLTRPMLVDEAAFAASGVVVASQEDRLNVGAGGRIYVDGLQAQSGDRFTIYRVGRALSDPVNGAMLGVEAVFIGVAQVVKPGPTSSVDVVSSVQEVGRGDRLLAVEEETPFAFAPRPPADAVDARIVTMHDARSGESTGAGQRAYETQGGTLSVVVLNKGWADGLEPGHVLSLVRPGRVLQERNSAGYRNGTAVGAPSSLPEEAFGSLMVFKPLERVSYGIVLSAVGPVSRGDMAVTPVDD